MSGFVVSARKYRPVRFDEVVGQSHVTDTLKRAIQTDKIAHAFLFCGPRGVGKTTCARILAKSLNCLNPSEDKEPCNVCSSCQAFNDNASFNIIELDAASHNGVDNIRSLVEQVNIQPQSGEYKVFIIDEVHMLSIAAFNAFLKTLEEPPKYAIFILATTEKHKILPTILSRCQIYDFKRIDANDIVRHLQQICAAEKVEAEEEALYIIAQKADGALRDALSMLDRLTNQSDNVLTYQQVIDSLGMVDYESYFQMTEYMLAEDAAGMLMLLDRAVNQGYEAEEIMKGLAGHIRDLMFFKHDKLQPLVRLPERLMDRYRQQASMISESLLINGLDMITDTLYRAQLSPDKSILFQITLSKLAYLNRLIKSNGQPIVTSVDDEKKKTADVTNIVPNAGPPLEKSRKEPQKEDIQAVQPDRTSERNPTPQPLKTKGRPMSILSSLEKIASVVDQEQNKKQNERPFNDDELDHVWSEFTEGIESEYVKRMLTSTILRIEDKTVHIVVDHKRVEEAITREFNCIMYLRQAFNNPELDVQIEVSETVEDEPKQKRLITQKEKFDFLVEKNPSILEMTRRFKLKFD